jgi:diaminopimelate decarboxylase
MHLHVGSQILDAGPLQRALEWALAFRERAHARGATISLVNLGGGFGIDYPQGRAEFPLEDYATRSAERARGLGIEWVLEPGRWLVAPAAVLVARVLWVKAEGVRRTVVIAAGMNDLLRPALYAARHRIESVVPRSGSSEPAMVVGPVCESADVFDAEALLPPVEPGDLLVIRDVGAYGAAMASNYNGRPRLAEIVVEGGAPIAVRAPEAVSDLARGACAIEL